MFSYMKCAASCAKNTSSLNTSRGAAYLSLGGEAETKTIDAEEEKTEPEIDRIGNSRSI